MRPEDIAGSSESSQQKAFFCWARIAAVEFPCLDYMFAIPNGGKRDKITAARLKAEGVKSGVPDIFLPFPMPSQYSINWRRGLWIEMKVEDGRISPDQAKYRDYLRRQGYSVVVAYNWEQARDATLQYLKGEL